MKERLQTLQCFCLRLVGCSVDLVPCRIDLGDRIPKTKKCTAAEVYSVTFRQVRPVLHVMVLKTTSTATLTNELKHVLHVAKHHLSQDKNCNTATNQLGYSASSGSTTLTEPTPVPGLHLFMIPTLSLQEHNYLLPHPDTTSHNMQPLSTLNPHSNRSDHILRMHVIPVLPAP